MLVVRRSRYLPIILGLLHISSAGAQEPAINGTSPGALAPGAAIPLQLNGGNLASAKKLWLSFPGESVLAEGIDKNGENPAQVTYKVTVPADAACGVQGIRLVTDKGVSPLRLIFIDDLPSVGSVGFRNGAKDRGPARRRGPELAVLSISREGRTTVVLRSGRATDRFIAGPVHSIARCERP